jgi:hypothetical protein
MAMSFFFADDLAPVIAGQIGIRFTDQCIDLERRLHSFFVQLELYYILAVQPINYPNPMSTLRCGDQTIEWVSSFKYLGYWLTTKLGWGNIIGRACLRIRQQTAQINSIKFCGTSSVKLRRVLFSTFALPLFMWIFALYPLFTENQRLRLNHFYNTSLKRVYRCLWWEDFFFSSAYSERSLDDLCYSYWEKYSKSMATSLDGRLLIEQSFLNTHRGKWVECELSIRCLNRSKRFIQHTDVFGSATKWMVSHGTNDSVILVNEAEYQCFAAWPESF